jgi:hypothetical protein
LPAPYQRRELLTFKLAITPAGLVFAALLSFVSLLIDRRERLLSFGGLLPSSRARRSLIVLIEQHDPGVESTRPARWKW